MAETEIDRIATPINNGRGRDRSNRDDDTVCVSEAGRSETPPRVLLPARSRARRAVVEPHKRRNGTGRDDHDRERGDAPPPTRLACEVGGLPRDGRARADRAPRSLRESVGVQPCVCVSRARAASVARALVAARRDGTTRAAEYADRYYAAATAKTKYSYTAPWDAKKVGQEGGVM